MANIKQSIIGWFFFWLSAFVTVLWLSVAYALYGYTNISTTSSWATLTSSAWNEIVNNVNKSLRQESQIVTIDNVNKRVWINNSTPSVALDVWPWSIYSYWLSRVMASAITHWHMSWNWRENVSVIAVEYRNTITSSATADNFCWSQINWGWHACWVVKINHYNQPCDTVSYWPLSDAFYVSFVRAEDIASYYSTWTNCESPWAAFVTCSTTCPDF